jgi:hypothetical protein
MRLLIFTALALTAALVAAGPAIDVAAAPPPKNIPVSITFDDQTLGHRILSDGGEYRHGVNNVVAYIAASDHGTLIFGTNTSNQAGRTLQFSFDNSNCLSAPADCDAPWPSLDEKSGLQANALRGGSVPTGGLMAMTPGEELSAWIKFNIPLDSDPAYYNVCFDSRKAVGPCGAAPGGTSTDARIHRVALDEWTISASAGDASSGDRADLIRDSQTKRNRTFTTLGTYSMPFSFTVKCMIPADCS